MNTKALYEIFLKYKSVCTDTRKLKKNDIYFALKGDNFDGNKFVKSALENGASYCVVDDASIVEMSDKVIVVEDTLTTLQQLANYHRNQLTYPIIALTGSNGKTTTKELILSVLSSIYKVKATKGNLNNHIGVPLTLLSFTKGLNFGIVEMGANHQKEIEFLSAIAEPNFGLITNFGKAHLEGFGGVEGVIKGKSELYDYLKANQKTVFINTDDEKQIQQIGDYNNIVTFGENTESNCIISFNGANPFVYLSYNNISIKTQLIGSYNYNNIAVAVAIGKHFKVPTSKIKSAIEAYQPDNNRSEIREIKSNKIILDAYNANPTSMLAALTNFKQLEAEKKVLFLGDMFELGESASEEHQSIVNFSERNFEDNIYLVGENFYLTQTNEKTNKFSSFENLKAALKTKSIQDTTILIKGSRGMALERILEIL
ncbi:UDP-N-acetylmuramoyl-tripeptide--D-alanyl-D-alanine ligase [Winogradskyella sp. PC-19]|uniref:UDP-N-acetylmuramoyl-tripeptide--D-alanyl-D- alanine ligase n=1 Tax=unclassified Winogradskyella TaxID=2615021 RepID=UPI000B3C3D7B|nr:MULTISPECIES: UDP-N-acetylmuramoyl-tripeptide--D-alanyl-D-alanine ligase [unclassified Winogradskyella]ARV09260.1 UDP-N-acetylmuramoyl-tripeptide--D-alanyl-D-alanine ligase [Winogradskyella sp. PC-19]